MKIKAVIRDIDEEEMEFLVIGLGQQKEMIEGSKLFFTGDGVLEETKRLYKKLDALHTKLLKRLANMKMYNDNH